MMFESMGGNMRTILGILIYIIFVIGPMFGAMTLSAVNTWAFDRSFYSDAFNNEQFYDALLNDELPGLYSDTVFTTSDGRQLPPAAINAGLREIVTPEYLQDQITTFIDNIFDVLEGNTDDVSLTFDLTPIKDRLAGADGADFAEVYAANLPECAADEEPRAASGELPVCIPANLTVAQMAEQIESTLPQLLAAVPDEVGTEAITLNDLDTVFPLPTLSSLLGMGITLIALVAGLFWLLAALVGGIGMRGRFLWLGVMLLLPALAVLGLGLAVSGSTQVVVNQAMADVTTEFSPELIDITVQQFATRIANGFFLVGGIAAGVALLLMGLGVLSPRPRRRDDDVISVPA